MPAQRKLSDAQIKWAYSCRLSQGDAARELGVSRITVNRIRNRKLHVKVTKDCILAPDLRHKDNRK